MSTYVRLRLGSEAYAIPVGHALEIAELGDVTPVPRAPAEVLGVKNLRGQILPVLDLAALLGTQNSRSPRLLLVAEAGGHRGGFAVDEVSQVGELADPAEEAESDLLLGATLTDHELVGVIDVPRIFGSLERQP
ncbi:MAG TPA: chemotaxis protein CheW [Streptosporangiaceae bacterium]|jgi:chemotaxis signal transduction protein|nr:chemotaxis protein CheW [Streptosporangiaceae bacterium]